MRRNRIASVAMLLALPLGTVGVGAASAEPSFESELCRQESVQRWMTFRIFGENVNYGRCMAYFSKGYDPSGDRGGCAVNYYGDGTHGIQCYSGDR